MTQPICVHRQVDLEANAKLQHRLSLDGTVKTRKHTTHQRRPAHIVSLAVPLGKEAPGTMYPMITTATASQAPPPSPQSQFRRGHSIACPTAIIDTPKRYPTAGASTRLAPPLPFPRIFPNYRPVSHLLNLELHVLLGAPGHRGRGGDKLAPHVDDGLLRHLLRVLNHRPTHIAPDKDSRLHGVQGLPEDQKDALLDGPVQIANYAASGTGKSSIIIN